MKYRVTIGGETRELELTTDGVRIGGRVGPAELVSVPGSPLRHLRLGDRGYALAAERIDGGWALRLAGRRVEAEVEDERARAIRELAGESRQAGGTEELRAPMPGLVVRVLVEAGQQVKAGEGLVVMEAMKMENELRAEAGGTVASIEVREGQTVDRRDALVVLKPEDGDG